MSNQYDIVFPARGRQVFDGGKNNKFERSIIAPNESPDCFNVVFSNGAVETRAGSTKLNTTAVGSFAFDGLFTRRDNTSAETMVAFANGSAWELATTTFTVISGATSIMTAGVAVGATQMENHLFMGNGYVTAYKYNGTNFTRHGVPAATGLVSAASITSSTGVINGEARYKIAYVNSAAAYGDVGTATVTLAVTNGAVYLTGIPVAPASHGVNARRIYRNFVSGATSSYGLVATISDNTTTTYVDNALDAALTTAAPTDNGEPPKYSWIVQHAGRLFCNDVANPGYVWYSEIFEPYTWPSSNFQQVGDASADLVKGGAVYNDGIVITGERATYTWVMPTTDENDWLLIRVKAEFGSRSPYSFFEYNNRLAFAAVQNTKFVGFAALSGKTIDPEASVMDMKIAGSDRISDRIEPDIFDIAEGHIPKIRAMVFKNKAYIAVPYGDDATTNNRIYIFDFSISNLKKQDASWAPLDGINAASFTIYGGYLYYATSDATGFVYRLEASVYSDDGAAIDSYYWTKEFAGNPGHENLQKDFRKVKLLVEKAGAYYMGLTWRVDSDHGGGLTKQIDLTPGSAIWGDFMWGAANWGAGTDQEEVTVSLGQSSGKRIQFKFSNQNTAGQRFKVHGLNFTYNIKGKR